VNYSDNFKKAFAELIGNEGGYKCEAEDHMDWSSGVIGKGELRGTKFGLSAGTYPNLDIKNLTVEQAQAIYYTDWWTRFGGENMPYELAFQVFDSEVNHGHTMGIKFLQKALDVAADGIVGAITLGRVRAMDEDKLIMRFLAVRMRFFTKCSTWDKHGRGWANRVANLLMAATE
jgi:lysozyme family protein